MQAMRSVTAANPVVLPGGEATEAIIRDDGSVPILESREIDALIVDEFDAVYSARASGGQLRVLAEPIALEQYAFVLAPDDTSLKLKIDATFGLLENDGTVAALQQRFRPRS